MCQNCNTYHGRETVDPATLDSTAVLDVKGVADEKILGVLKGFPRNKKLVVINFSQASQEVRTALMELSDAGIARVYWETCPIKA